MDLGDTGWYASPVYKTEVRVAHPDNVRLWYDTHEYKCPTDPRKGSSRVNCKSKVYVTPYDISVKFGLERSQNLRRGLHVVWTESLEGDVSPGFWSAIFTRDTLPHSPMRVCMVTADRKSVV